MHEVEKVYAADIECFNKVKLFYWFRETTKYLESDGIYDILSKPKDDAALGRFNHGGGGLRPLFVDRGG